jgi:hypothetical protein
MNIVQVAHHSVDQRFIRGRRNTLPDTRPQKAVVVLPRAASPRAGDDQQHHSNHKQMSFAPDARRRDEEGRGDTNTQEIPSRQFGHFGKRDPEVDGQSHSVGGENGAQRGRENGSYGQGKCDQIPFPQRPVEGIVGVVGRLRDEDDGHRAAGVALEARNAIGGILRSLGVVKISRRACNHVSSAMRATT